MPCEEWFPVYGVLKIKQGSSKCTTWASTQNVARLNSDYPIHWKNSRCDTNHFRSILFPLLQILNVTELFRIYRRLQKFPKLTRQAMYVPMYKRNIEELCCIQCCRGKAVNITYPDFVFVAFGIQHAMHMRHIIVWGLPCSTMYFHIIS